MRQISRARFDALAAYARGPLVSAVAQEIGWFAEAEEALLGVVFVDRDAEYSAVVLVRDSRERFRAVRVIGPYATPEGAIRQLRPAFASASRDLGRIRIQGDEAGAPVDFLTPVVPADKLHRGFRALVDDEGFRAARRLIGEMMRWYEEADGNFIEQFQTTGFDARLWELYLYAMLVETGYAVTRPEQAPDFLAYGLGGELAIEATTVNPSQRPDGSLVPSQRPEVGGDVDSYLMHYLPIKFAGPLTAKLKKQDWRRSSVANKPFVLAIQDFHDSLSMTYSGAPLAVYLYGYRNEIEILDDGSSATSASPVKEHVWGSKIVPSGFFSLPEAEHISAVIFNGTATLSKFNRMGVKVGYGVDDVVLIRHLAATDPRPEARRPLDIVEVVGEGHSETWIEGMNVYHNPNAMQPIDPKQLPGAAHHHLLPDGRLQSTMPMLHPIASRTSIVSFAGRAEAPARTE